VLSVLSVATDRLATFATLFLGLVLEALPFLLLGVLASALIQRWVPTTLVTRLVPRSRISATALGGLLGMALPVCECGVVPLGRRLLDKGAPLPLALAFIVAGPVVNPVVLVSTWTAFGGNPGFVLGRFGLALLVAILVSLAFSLHPSWSSLLVTSTAEHSLIEGKAGVLRLATREFMDLSRYLMLGGVLAACLQTFVPRTALLALGSDTGLSVLVLMAVAVLLSVCSSVDAFVALSFAGTFNTGALMAFLLIGPLVNLKSAAMYSAVLRRPAMLVLWILCAQLIFLLGSLVNLSHA
jgi:uncharacterized protein